jgi:thymidylate synthase (FAD)
MGSYQYSSYDKPTLNLLVPDRWKQLRQDMNLFRSVEPEVKIIGYTQPTEELRKKGVTTDTLPAYTARHCYESSDKYSQDPKKDNELDKDLTRRLINMGHTTPLQAIEFTFDIYGTSKSLQAQWTRHKIGVGWSYRSTRFVEASGNKFVYNIYDYISDVDKVKKLLRIDEEHAKRAIGDYNKKRDLGSTKQDARKIMPVEFATDCSFFANASALTHLFHLRLATKPDWDISRMSGMILEEVMKITPTIFEDICNNTFGKLKKD